MGLLELSNASRVVILSVGATLAGWARELRAHPGSTGKELVTVEWKPAKPARASAAAAGGGGGGSTLPALARRGRPADASGADGKVTVRLWAFGNALVRQRVKEQVADWIDGIDIFVA